MTMFRRTLLLACGLLLAGCADSSENLRTGDQPEVTGAHVEPSGFLTVTDAPAPSYAGNPNEAGAGRLLAERSGAAMGEPALRNWYERLRAAGVPLQPFDRGQGVIAVSADRATFERIMAEAQLDPPSDLPLSFTRPFDVPALDPALDGRMHPVPHLSHEVSIPTLGSYARLVARDGCLLLQKEDGEEALAVLPAALGLTLDDEGYLAVRYRYSNLSVPLARVGTRIGPFTVLPLDKAVPVDDACASYPQTVISDVRTAES